MRNWSGLHQHRVLAVVGGILRGSQDIEDVAQQALAKAYFSIRRFDLALGVRDVAVQDRRQRVLGLFAKEEGAAPRVRIRPQRRASAKAGMPFRNTATAGPRIGKTPARRLEQRQLVERLLGELDDNDQIMLVMKEVEGFSVEEIGRTSRTERQHGESAAISGARAARGNLPEANAKASGDSRSAQAAKE